MSQWIILAGCYAALTGPVGASGKASTAVELYRSEGWLTLHSLTRPSSSPTHTYVLTHGLGGSDERFFELGRLIQALEPGALVLVVEWDPALKERIGSFPNPWAAAKRIDPTGDVLASALSDLHRRKVLDLQKSTFIGESFGNYVNHRAAAKLNQDGLGKAHAALVLNPANELGGYEPPLITKAYAHSVVFVSDSPFDTQKTIGQRTVHLKARTTDPFVQHTFGMHWLRWRVLAGERIDTHFQDRPEVAVR